MLNSGASSPTECLSGWSLLRGASRGKAAEDGFDGIGLHPNYYFINMKEPHIYGSLFRAFNFFTASSKENSTLLESLSTS